MMRLKELRIEKGLLQKDLAKALNKSTVCIGDWERERTEPSIPDLVKLAELFEVSIDFLIGRTDDFGNVQINSPDLSRDETELLTCFRRSNKTEKDALLTTAKAFASKL